MRSQIRGDIARERNRILRELAAEKNLRFRESFVGRATEAITLQRQHAHETEALTDNYLKLRIAGEHAPNQWLKLRVAAVSSDGLIGVAA